MCKIADWMIWILLALCAICDWRKKEIPLLLLITMSFLVTIFAIFCKSEPVFSRMIGIFLGLGFFFVSKCTQEAIGYGDSWIILLLGGYLGCFRALQILFFAAVAAGFCSLFFLWKNRWNRDATIPFVPFIAVAYLGAMFT